MITPLRSQDVLDCYRIYQRVFSEKAARVALGEMGDSLSVEELKINFYVARINSKIVGCAGMQKTHLHHDVYDLINIAVDPSAQFGGIGRALTGHRIEQARKLGGASVHALTIKPGFFQRLGFETAYTSGEMTMVFKVLKPLEL